jgi:hypothetical protein
MLLYFDFDFFVFQGQFALDASARAISFYKNYFGVSYPLPKYDCIAISDFQCGAMENWGLVNYNFTGLVNYNFTGLVNCNSTGLVNYNSSRLVNFWLYWVY